MFSVGTIQYRILYLARGFGFDRIVFESLHLDHGIVSGYNTSSHGTFHSDLIQPYMGQLCQGKNDLEAIENFRTDCFFKQALEIGHLPSASRLRQRFNQDASELLPWMYEAVVEFLAKAEVPVTPLANGYVALDIDVFPMNNSGTSK